MRRISFLKGLVVLSLPSDFVSGVTRVMGKMTRAGVERSWYVRFSHPRGDLHVEGMLEWSSLYLHGEVVSGPSGWVRLECLINMRPEKARTAELFGTRNDSVEVYPPPGSRGSEGGNSRWKTQWQKAQIALASVAGMRGMVSSGETEDGLRANEFLARRPSTPPEILELIFESQPSSSFWLASNPNASPELLRRLFEYEGDQRERCDVRNIARNPSTPPDLLRRMVEGDPANSIAWGNPNLPTELLSGVAVLGRYGLEYVAANPSTPPDVLRRIAERYETDNCLEFDGLAEVAANPNTPKDVLDKLASHNHPFVLAKLASNPALAAATCDETVDPVPACVTPLRVNGDRYLRVVRRRSA